MVDTNPYTPAATHERPPIISEQLFASELAHYNQHLRESEEQIAMLQDQLQLMQYELIRDRETQLFSLAYFHSRLNEEIVRSERYRHFLSVILMHVELTQRHSTTQVTRELNRIGLELMTGLTRRTDIVALYRKRQIVIMLPETDPRGAAILMQRYESVLANKERRLSYSLLTYPNDASNIELILNRLQDISEDLFRGTGHATP